MNHAEKQDTIRAMLETFEEARSEPSGPGGGGVHNESRALGWDATTYTPAYRELERVIEKLKYLAAHGRPIIGEGVSAARAYWHLKHRYLVCEKRRRPVHVVKKRNGDRVTAGIAPNEEIVGRATILQGKVTHVTVRVWDPKVDAKIVDVAIGWLAREFRGQPAVYRGEGRAA